jgi:predicted nucleic acid-binding protein
VTGMAYLLDTNALSEFLKRTPNRNVIDWFARTDESDQFISVFSIGEIQKGISKLAASRRRNELQAWFDQLIIRYQTRILPFGLETAKIWGKLLIDAERRGQLIPIVDSQIAATAIEHDLTIITRNTSDFSAAKASVLDIWA